MAARFRAGNRCEFCGAPGDHVHHVIYPKNFSQDCIDNLVVVCEIHHALSHGIRGEKMSSDMILVLGVETIDREWIDFDQLFLRLYESGIGTQSMRDSLFRASNEAWKLIFDKYKKITEEVRFDGVKKFRRWVNRSGVLQLSAKYDSRQTIKFQEWLFEELLPELDRTGKYDMQSPVIGSMSTGDSLKDVALSIIKTMEIVVSVRDEAIEAKRVAEMASSVAREANVAVAIQAAKLEDMSRRISDITGEKLFISARHFLQKNGINPQKKYKDTNDTNSKTLGGWCTRENRRRGLDLPPKITEGGFEVNQYPVAFLHEGAKALGLFNDIKENTPSNEQKTNEGATSESEPWRRLLYQSKITGLAGELAHRCALVSMDNQRVVLELDHNYEHLRSASAEKRLLDALMDELGGPIRLEIRVAR